MTFKHFKMIQIPMYFFHISINCCSYFLEKYKETRGGLRFLHSTVYTLMVEIISKQLLDQFAQGDSIIANSRHFESSATPAQPWQKQHQLIFTARKRKRTSHFPIIILTDLLHVHFKHFWIMYVPMEIPHYVTS